jgi:hypothetical protein
MSFKRLDPEDFLVSVDSITATAWSTNSPTLTTFFTSSVTSSNDSYYKNIYQTASTLSNAAVQFAIAYGNQNGSGSANFNDLVPGVSPTRTIYGQYRNLIYGSENAAFIFTTVTASDFWAISVDRARYKEHLLKGTFNITLSGSGIQTLKLTDNSGMVSTDTYLDCGRVYQIISGSNGVANTSVNANGYSLSSGSYGLFLPDIATIILNPLALSQSINLEPSRSSDSDGLNIGRLFTAISGAASFQVNSEETVTSDFVFVRARNSEFNYSENPSFISGSTGDVIFSNFINSPQTYMTTVGFYNDSSELLAVAKLSKPLTKDFTKEALIRVKLDF